MTPPCDKSRTGWERRAHTRAEPTEVDSRKRVSTEEPESWLLHGVGCLRYKVKNTNKIIFVPKSYLYGDAAEGSADDSRDSQRAVVLQGVGAVGADELCVVHFGERSSHKL